MKKIKIKRDDKDMCGGLHRIKRKPKKDHEKSVNTFWFYLLWRTHIINTTPPTHLSSSISVRIFFGFLLGFPFKGVLVLVCLFYFLEGGVGHCLGEKKHMDASSSSSSSWKGMMEQGNEPHVLAVDDNIIDRKLVEKLLKNSSCKGTQLLSRSPFKP